MNQNDNAQNNIDRNLEDTGRLMTQAKPEMNRKKVIIIAAVALIAVILIGFFGIRALGEKRYEDKVAVAEKYMQEGDYDQAEAAYLDAVGMNKRKPKAREGLAYVYAVQSKFDKAQQEYESLYTDTNDAKYQIAARDVSEGRMPSDSSLAVATPWRKISLSDAPYPVAMERFVLETAWTADTGLSYDAAAEPRAEEASYLMDLMAGYSGVLVTPADEITEDAYYESPWTTYYEDDEGEELAWEPDPRGWFQYGYFVCEQERLEKYLKDIFNFSDEAIEIARQVGEDYQTLYLQDGYYYKLMPVGGGAFDYQINTVWTNGRKYCVKYDSILLGANEDGSDYVDEFYEMLELKTIDGKPYWTMSYNGPEMPEEVKEKRTEATSGSGEEYTAYADVLRANEDAIKSYWWQLDAYEDSYNEPNDDYDGPAGEPVNPCVALYDINGDGIQELLFMSSDNIEEAELHIYTYTNGQAVECNYAITTYDGESSIFYDVQAAGGTDFIICGGKEKGSICIVHGIGDEVYVDTQCILSMDGNGGLKQTYCAQHEAGSEYDDWGEYIGEYEKTTVNGKETDSNGWSKALKKVKSDYSSLIMLSGSRYMSYYNLTETAQPLAMSYDEAIEMLTR